MDIVDSECGLTIKTALAQSRLSAARELPGKEVREVCVAKRIRTMSELSTRSLQDFFRQTTCSGQAQKFFTNFLQENGFVPIGGTHENA